MIPLNEFFALAKSHKKVISAVVVAIALLVGALYVKGWYNDQLTEKYNAGVTDTDTKWTLVMQKNKDEQAAFKSLQQAKVDELAAENARLKAENTVLATASGKRQTAYAQSDEGKKQGLDDEAVEIYNESLGIQK